jgi:MipA family protein
MPLCEPTPPPELQMTARRLAAALPLLLVAGAASAQGDFPIPLPLDHLPNAVAIGVGAAPTYLGSSDYFFGAAPAAALDTPVGRMTLLGNYLAINVLSDFDTGGFAFGPAAIYRFGRTDVDDPVVTTLPQVDDSLELGATVGYEFVDAQNPIWRARAGVDLTWNVTDEDGGGAASVYFRGIAPLPWKGGAAVALAAVTFATEDFSDRYFSVDAAGSTASGLPVFDAGGGGRDARVGFGVLQSLSPNWHVGAGGVYSRLIGDAAESPIVRDRGASDQFIFGIGVAYAWGFDD